MIGKDIEKKNFIWNALGLTFNSLNSMFFFVTAELINGVNDAGVFTYAFSLCCLFFVFSIYVVILIIFVYYSKLVQFVE